MSMIFRILQGSSSPDVNSYKGGNRLAAEKQTDYEHEQFVNPATCPATRDQYRLAMALMPPGPQRDRAIDALANKAALYERTEVPQYWDDDTSPRRPLYNSSSWVGPIMYDPEMKLLSVNGYTSSAVEPVEVAKLLNGTYPGAKTPGSIGSCLNVLWKNHPG